MKTIRFYTGVLALLLATSGAIASSYFSPQNPVYHYIDNTWPWPDECDAIDLECGTTFQYPCKINWSGPTFRSSPNPVCGVELTRQTSPAPFQP